MNRSGLLSVWVFAMVLGVFGNAYADSVSGEGSAGSRLSFFAVVAQSGAGGENASGDLMIFDGPTSYYGAVSQLCASEKYGCPLRRHN